jgi:hypothetical protein
MTRLFRSFERIAPLITQPNVTADIRGGRAPDWLTQHGVNHKNPSAALIELHN